MSEGCCGGSGCGCGCNETALYSEENCPECGRRLRITGDIMQIKMHLSCPGCGYQGPLLTIDELRALID